MLEVVLELQVRAVKVVIDDARSVDYDLLIVGRKDPQSAPSREKEILQPRIVSEVLL